MIANVMLILCGFAIISLIWGLVGSHLFDKLGLKDPENTKQYIIALIIVGPIALMLVIREWFCVWLKKFYNS